MSELFVFICTRTTAATIVPPSASLPDLNRRVTNAFRANTGGVLTVGDLKLRPNGLPIPNHLLCNGVAVSRIAFPDLFAFLGISEGPGDGSTTFNIPNYVGVTLAVPATVPEQTVTTGGTVTSTDAPPPTEPTTSGETGGVEGVNVISGGRADRQALP